ncbi:MAG: DUF4124 domain-containing protein [Gammaproteobacteria bacterium]|nr:DUF4124 domain-containing protein [Gammaproteobacteria bacterium]
MTAILLMAFLAVPALAANGSDGQVYTWVDNNGARHYSGHPSNPKAKPINVHLNPNSGSSAKPAAPAAQTTAGSEQAKPTAPASTGKPAMTPEQRAALCAKLRGQVKQLESARRVKFTKDGEVTYYSGEDLVAFKARMQKRMHQVCTPLKE